MAGQERYLPSSSRILEAQMLIEAERNRNRNHNRSLILEDRISIQHREIQKLLTDNKRLAVAHIGLKDQLNMAKRELSLLLETAAKVNAERDAKVREVYQDALRIEAQARVIDGLGGDLGNVRADVEKLSNDSKEQATELVMLSCELAKAKPNADRANEVKAEIEILREEVGKGSDALEAEIKARASNLHHERGMEKTIDHLKRETVKLRQELLSLQAKETPNTSPGLVASYGNSDGGEGDRYPEANGSHQVYGSVECLPQHLPTSLQHPPKNTPNSSVQ